jgi:hypothetical protein
VRRSAAVPADRKGLGAAGVRRFGWLVAALARPRDSCGGLAGAFEHFRMVTRGYRPGLFRCYDVEGVPRTNNAPERFFGSYRCHERRCSGWKAACPGTMVRGSVRLVPAATTWLRAVEAADPVPSDPKAWRDLRGSLEKRRAVRAPGRCFRRDPGAYRKSRGVQVYAANSSSWRGS